MHKILITGATGSVGIETIKALKGIAHDKNVFAGVRDIEKDQKKLAGYALNFTRFDFADPATFKEALADCDTLFLLRPPPTSQHKEVFQAIHRTSS
ncbi:SDR family oxidoreductase [Persicitalea sp.]|uniref:SDR family oxidoreductase n=1 Tax=Persicitalea sp. TaxID=3100273 RepID=UPI0035946D72